MNKTCLLAMVINTTLLFFANSCCAQIAGTLDSSFNNTGFVTNVVDPNSTLGSNGTSLAIQNDGKIIVTAVSANNNILLVRYNSNGSMDNSFGVNGTVETDFGSIEEANDLVLQQDGKIVVGGGRVGPIANSDMLITRYNSDGSIDASFGTNGYTEIDYFNRIETIRSIALAPDGSIIGIGETSYTATAGNDSIVIMIIKLRSNGLPDSTFNEDGIALLSHTEDTYGFSVKVQPDGKIIAGGWAVSQPSGSYIMEMLVARFNSNGTLDTTFGTGGKSRIHFGVADDQSLGYSLAVQNDGKIIIAGSNRRPGQTMGPEIALARLNANGTPDIAFGTNGQTRTFWGDNKLVHCGSIALQADGRIVAAGYSYDTLTGITYISIARYNPNGIIDNTFNGNGKLNSAVSQADRARKVDIQNDGKIVICGHSYSGSFYTTTIARYHSGAPLGIKHVLNPIKDLTVYPNHINLSSVLQYVLSGAAYVDIDVFDMNGRVVMQLINNEAQLSGTHTISLSQLSLLPSGMYLIHIVTSDETGSIKIMVE